MDNQPNGNNGINADPVIVCAPVVILTQEESDKLASWTPFKPLKNHNNAILVAAGATPETLAKGMADVFVVHHAQNKTSGKARVVAQWQIPVPVLELDFRGGSHHIFRVKLDDMRAPGALDPKPADPAPADHEDIPEDLRAGNVKVPIDIPVPTVSLR